MNVIDVEQSRRVRGAILELVCENHLAQRSRLNLVTLWGRAAKARP
jgi:hypothetical protein